MATITDLKMQKNKSRVNVYLDNVFVCGMELSTIMKNRLKVGSEITQAKLTELQTESELDKALEKAFSLVERKKYTKIELFKKLKEKGYLPEVSEVVIKKLEEYGYVDDTNYAESYIRANSLKSKKEIEYNLKQKGVSEHTIKEIIDSSGIDEHETIKTLANKFMKYKENTKENRTKLMSYLYRKGFGFSAVEQVVREYGDCEE